MSDTFSHRFRIDQICDEFEEAWSTGQRPSFSPYLDLLPESQQHDLLQALLEVDIELRARSGESVKAHDYRSVSPDAVELAQQILRSPTVSKEAFPLRPGVIDQESTQGVEPSQTDTIILRQLETRQIGPYRLLEEIGQGGMGTVWKAQQTEPVKLDVALKVIRADMGSRETIARFEVERQALALMDHPSIAKVLNAGTTPSGNPYFVMELVDGIPLTTYCDQNQLSIRQRLELMIAICHAIQHAHQKGIIHRDLKPGNILVTESDGKPIPKVIDFGLAKAIDYAQKLTDKTMATGIGQILGTLQYMSPEQAEMNSFDIDTRTDVYALGVILYELLTGTTPLDQATLKKNPLLKVLELIRTRQPPRPSSRLSHAQLHASSEIGKQRKIALGRLHGILRGELDWVVMKALEIDRARRYESADRLAQDLRRFLKDEPVEARPPSRAYQFQKFVQKNRMLVVAASVTLGLLVSGIASSTWFAVQANRARHRAEEAAEKEKYQRQLAVKAQHAAQTSANNRLEMMKILSGSFRSVDPDQGAAANMTAKDVLYIAIEELKRSTLDDPSRMLMLETLTTSLIGVGEYPTAIQTASDCVALSEKLYGQDDLKTLACQHNLALAMYHAGQTEAAFNIRKQVFEKAEQKIGVNHPETLRFESALVTSLMNRGDDRLALRKRRGIVERCKKVFGETHERTLSAQYNLAFSLENLDQDEAAMKIRQQVVRQAKEELGETDPLTLQAMESLANSFARRGKPKDHQQSLRLRHQVLRLKRQKLGYDHPRTLDTMADLVVALNLAKRYHESIELGERTLALQRVKKGSDHPDVLLLLRNLSNSYQKTGDLQRSLKMDSENVKLTQQKLGFTHPQTLEAMHNLAVTCFFNQDHVQSLQLRKQVYDINASRLDKNHPDMKRTSYALYTGIMVGETVAMQKLAAGKFTEAEQLLRTMLESGTPFPAMIVAVPQKFHLALIGQRKWRHAQQAIEQWLDRNPTETNSSAYRWALSSLSVCLLEQGNRTKAKKMAERLLQNKTTLLIQRVRASSVIAICSIGSKDQDKSIQMAVAALEQFEKKINKLPRYQTWTGIRAMDRTIAALQKSGQTKLAETWSNKRSRLRPQ